MTKQQGVRKRVGDAGKTQPEGRNCQDAWAIYKNHKTGERNEATRQNDDRPWKYKEETNRGTQGSNKNQKTKRSNEYRQETRPGERSEEDAAGRDKEPELHVRRQPKEKRNPEDATGKSHSSVKRKKLPPGKNGRLSKA